MKFIRSYALLLVLLLGSTGLFGQSSKLSPDLLNLSLTGSVKIVVQLNWVPTLLDNLSLTAVGTILDSTVSLVPVVVMQVPVLSLNTLASLNVVGYISPDRAIVSSVMT